MKNSNKPKLNIVIDIIMFVAMMILAGIGFLMKYVLLPGFERNEIYGNSVELYYFGLDRHQWGDIHLVLSFALLFLLVLHIVFHWKQIIHLFKSLLKHQVLRILFTTVLVVLSIVFLIFPFFIEPEIEQLSHTELKHRNAIHNLQDSVLHRNQSNSGPEKMRQDRENERETDSSEDMHEYVEEHTSDINGQMTLSDIADHSGINLAELTDFLGIPKESVNERIGRLRKTYNFQMQDLRDFIELKMEEKK